MPPGFAVHIGYLRTATSLPMPSRTVFPKATRWLARSSLALSVLIALGALACKAYPQLPLGWLLGHCRATCPALDATTASQIALIILVGLSLVGGIVHFLDRLGVAEERGAGIVGRFARLASLAARTESAEPAPPTAAETTNRLAAAIASGLALASENEKTAARAKQRRACFHETDKSAIRAFLTKQSIFAALCLFLLKAVSSKLPTALPHSYQECINAFPQCLYVFAAGGFLIALLTVLVAVQTYSTYVRIQWDEQSANELLKKGREFDELSFYALSFSLLLALCAYQPWAALIAIPAFGILMYKYYFFKP